MSVNDNIKLALSVISDTKDNDNASYYEISEDETAYDITYSPGWTTSLQNNREVARLKQEIEKQADGKKYKAPTRIGMKRLGLVLPPEEHQGFLELADRLGVTNEFLGLKVITDLLKRYGFTLSDDAKERLSSGAQRPGRGRPRNRSPQP